MAKNVSKNLVAKKYAQALFELAGADKLEKNVDKDLADLAKSFDKSIYAHLMNTNLELDERLSAVDALLKKAKAENVTHDFCMMLTRQARIDLLPEIAAEFDSMLHEKEHTCIVQVTVAEKLTAAQEKKIIDNLKKTLDAKKVELDIDVDPEVLGGIRLSFGSTLIDNTFKQKIGAMAHAMKGI